MRREITNLTRVKSDQVRMIQEVASIFLIDVMIIVIEGDSSRVLCFYVEEEERRY